MSSCSQNDQKYIIEFIVFERKTTRPERNKGNYEYLIKWENYDWSQCTFIHASSIDNRNQTDTPFFYWNQLTKQQKYKRALFCQNWDVKNDKQKIMLGIQYIKQFKQLININVSNNLIYQNDNQRINENKQLNLQESSIISPSKSPPKKKKKNCKKFKFNKINNSNIIISNI